MKELDKLLDEYQGQFEENFPLMLCRHMEDDEIINIIKKCLKDDEPYEPELDPESNY